MRFTLLISALILSSNLFCQEGYKIEVDASNYTEDILYLGYNLGTTKYVKDTASRDNLNKFVFQGNEALEPGIYFVVFAPDNSYLEFLITEGNQKFILNFDKNDPIESAEFKGFSGDNKSYFEYLNYLSDKRIEVEEITDNVKSIPYKQKAEAINKQVRAYQEDIIKEQEGSFLAALIKSTFPLPEKEFEGSESEKAAKNYQYAKAHYFDNIEMSNPAMVRTPILESRVEYYLEKLTYKYPDSVNVSVDYILDLAKPNYETFKYLASMILNKYAKTKIIGFDAVYVHIADKYYASGMADWVEADQLKKIVDNSNKLKPILIGETAPELLLENKNKETVSLHDLESDYTVLYFWRYDCKGCQESTPIMKKFFEEYQDKGVNLVSVCTKSPKETQGCWDYVDTNDLGGWSNFTIPYNGFKYYNVYDVRSTPFIYVLDKNKEIISKRLGASQLAEVMNRFIAADKKK